jgi:hypothetical protein
MKTSQIIEHRIEVARMEIDILIKDIEFMKKELAEVLEEEIILSCLDKKE